MPGQESSQNRHPLRVWIKWALESGLFEKLPPEYAPEGSGTSYGTESYARCLLAELRNPDSGRRSLKQIIVDARQFRTWIEARQKDYRRSVLGEMHPGRTRWEVPRERGPSAATDRAIKPRRDYPGFPSGQLNPMWDDWLDA
jgi:hypothetical protein